MAVVRYVHISLTHTPTQANPKLHGDEWFQDLKARLERMHQEASAKKRPAKDKGRSKGGKHQDSVPDVPVRACIHFIHGETPRMVEWRVYSISRLVQRQM